MLPVFLLILFVLIEAAFIIQGYLAVQHAAREAARWAVTYRPVRGEKMDGTVCDNPSAGDAVEDFVRTNAGFNCDPGESEAEYRNRRVAIIKEDAVQRAAGLRIKALALTDGDFATHGDTPGFFGVRVFGDTWANERVSDHPGLPGRRVYVEVVHNVEIIDPLIRAIATHVQVRGSVNMINEGVQVGAQNPDDDDDPNDTPAPPNTPEPPKPPTPTHTPTPRPTSTPPPGGYQVYIPFDYVTNTLPLERGHLVDALVTNDQGTPLPDVIVSFSTDAGAYHYSGLEDVQHQYAEVWTGANGIAQKTIYKNDAGVANLRAWVDMDGNKIWSSDEPSDTAIKEWFWSDAPYIIASSYEVLPLEVISVDLYKHDPGQNSYTLLWCRTSITGGVEAQTLFDNSINVDGGGQAWDLETTIPGESAGTYRLETHSTPSTCGNAGTLAAASADIRVLPLPPDLRVTGISYPESYGDVLPADTEIPFMIEVENLNPWGVSAGSSPFDVDLYVNPRLSPPSQGQIGDAKQWLSTLGPYETDVVTVVLTLAPGMHELWAQVDTGNYVLEQDEDNNVFGPVVVDVDCTVDSTPYGDDFEDGSFDGKWQTAEMGTNVYGSVTESGDGHLQIHGRGSTIWGTSDNFFYVYQSIAGDFDARLRVVSPPGNNHSKLGLMIRGSASAASRHVLLAARDGNGRRLQFAYRQTDGGGTEYAGSELSGLPSPPVWLRIVRNGSNFAYYYAHAEEPGVGDWTQHDTGALVNMGDTVLVGMAHATYSSSDSRTSRSDEFVICQGGDGAPPPGLKECTQLIEAGSFEGNQEAVFEHWKAGEQAIAFQRTGFMQYDRAFSMRLHASLGGTFPGCYVLNPWLYQTVRIPSNIYTMTTITVDGYRTVGGSRTACSVFNSVDFDDRFYVQIEDGVSNPYYRLWPTSGNEPEDPSTEPVPPTETPIPSPTPTPTPMPPCLRDDFDDDVVGAEWTSAYIGDAAGRPGSVTESGGLMTVAGRGSSLWASDHLHFVYQEITGDFWVELEINSFGGSGGDWRKGGLMIRDSLQSQAPRVMVNYAPGQGVLQFAYRQTDGGGGGNDFASNVSVSLPVLVAVERRGNRFTAYYSTDGGVTWIQPTGGLGGVVNVTMDGDPMVGMGVSSYDDSRTLQASFEYIEICDVVLLPPTPTPQSHEHWQRFSADFSGDVDLQSLAGQDVNVRFFGEHDEDQYGTWFYVDDVACNVCTEWPTPEPNPDMATIGGTVWARLGASGYRSMAGVDVVAYRRGGTLYRTRSIHDGSYHFYNVPPGTYYIYAQIWIGNTLYTNSATVTLVSGERRDDIMLWFGG